MTNKDMNDNNDDKNDNNTAISAIMKTNTINNDRFSTNSEFTLNLGFTFKFDNSDINNTLRDNNRCN